MNDLISRQALCEYALNQKDKSITPNDIMRFPSAEPKTCAYWDREGNLCALNRPFAQPEVTEEAVKDYCRKRRLTILTNDYFHKLTSKNKGGQNDISDKTR